MLQINDPAPEFNSPNQNNKTVSLADFKNNKNVILYFYPKDDTPGCTIEAGEFTQYINDFTALDTVIIGVSKDSCQSHVDFINKFNIGFDLLADTSGEVCETYKVWQEKEKNGVKKMGIVRSTFLIGKDGKLKHAEYGVNAEGHAAAMLEKVRGL